MNKEQIIAVDIGGTNSRVCLFSDQGTILKSLSFLTILTDPQANFKKICEFIQQYPQVKIVAIAAPGPADYNLGIFGFTPNLPQWNKFNFIKFIQQHTHVRKIVAENDANLMALAQHFHFQQPPHGITQFFTVSTGLGAGLIVNNDIYRGFNGQALDIANLPVAWTKEKGKDLSEGALEYFASGSGIALRGKKHGFSSTKDVFDHYQSSAQAQTIIDQGIEAFANALAVAISWSNPNLIVIDGSLARKQTWFVQQAIKLAKTRVFPSQLNDLRFEITKLGDNAALYGGYYLALLTLQ